MTPEEKKECFELLTKYSPILPITLTVIGVVKTQALFAYYGLNIVPYLEISEVIFYAIDDLYIYTVIGFFFFGPLYLYVTYDSISEIIDDINASPNKKKVYNYFKYTFIFAIILILISNAISYYFYRSIGKVSLNIITFLIMVFALLSPAFFIKRLSKPYYFVTLTYFYIFIGILTTTAQTVLLKIIDIEKGVYINSSFNTEKKEYCVDNDHYYLGSIKSYQIIYNRLSNTTIMIPISEIKEMQISYTNKSSIKRILLPGMYE